LQRIDDLMYIYYNLQGAQKTDLVYHSIAENEDALYAITLSKGDRLQFWCDCRAPVCANRQQKGLMSIWHHQ
jgi:hypothetical protein